MMRISLHHLAITETTPTEFVETAAALGCDHVCLFVKIPAGGSIPIHVSPRRKRRGGA
jgi:hypothetical protein